MPLISNVFNDRSYKAEKTSDNVLTIDYGKYVYHDFDFAARVMVSRYNYNNAVGVSVTPFTHLDGRSIDTMRKKLIDLGGKPPAP